MKEILRNSGKWNEMANQSQRNQRPPNKALQRRPRSAVLMHIFITVRGPAERRRWAPWPQSLMSAVAFASGLVWFVFNRCASAIRIPAAITKHDGERRASD